MGVFNFGSASIEDIAAAEKAILALRQTPVTFLSHTIKKLTRGQAREIAGLATGESLAELFGSGLKVDLSDIGQVRSTITQLLQTVEGLLDLVLDYGSNMPGGTGVRDSIDLDEQLGCAGAVLIVNFSANAALRLFSGGVGSAAQSASEPSTEPTSPEPERSGG